jgi:signal transduction histidine kinase
VNEVRSTYEDVVLTTDGGIPDVEVRADDMLGSVFRNLLTNAIEHNDEAVREVTVAATATDGRVVVRVADNGPGIPDDRKDAIFEEGEKGLDSEGTGLGLYLVETLVERYDGDIRVEDNEPKGAVFVVELPVVE